MVNQLFNGHYKITFPFVFEKPTLNFSNQGQDSGARINKKTKTGQSRSGRAVNMTSSLLLPSVRTSPLLVNPISLTCKLLHNYSKPPVSSIIHRNNKFLNFKSKPYGMASSVVNSSSQMSSMTEGINGAVDELQLIRKHQESASRLSPVEEIRTLLDRSTRGVLSTFSMEHEGYPSGSMVDFACDHDGAPILAISSLAVHSKNLLGNPRCSLLVAKDPEDRTDTVITLYGDAMSVPEDHGEAVRTAYLKRHPTAFWVDFGDFSFVRIEPKHIRYVSGVATALLGSGEFNAEEFKTARVDPIAQFSVPIASHMNKDHAEDTKAIVQHSLSVKVDYANIVDVDSLGFNAKAGYQGSPMKLRIPFPRSAQDRKDVKTLIVEMLQAARDSSSS